MEKRRRPRALTLTLPDEHQPTLILDRRKYTLRNLSEDGIGVWVPPPAPYDLKKGHRVTAELVLDDRIYPVELEVARESERMLGLKILHKSDELGAIFKQLLRPSFYAADLVRHPKSETESFEGTGPRLWYVGKPGVELVVWYHEFKRSILALQILWAAKWVYRQQFQRAQTGFIGDTDARAGADSIGQTEETRAWAGRKVPAAELLEVHSETNAELLAEAAQFLTSVPHPLPGALFWQFLETGEQVFLPESFFSPRKTG